MRIYRFIIYPCWCWGTVGPGLRLFPLQLQDEDAALLPTKTSLVNGQKLGSLPFADNAGFQVAFNLVAIGAGGGIVRCSEIQTIGRSLVLQGGVPMYGQWSGGIGKVAQWALKFCCCEAWTLSVVARGEVV